MQGVSMSRLFILALLSAINALSHDDSVKSLDVPEPVFDFILGCERGLRGGPKLPVATMEFDPLTGESYEQVNLLDFKKLRNSLDSTIDNQKLVDSIFNHIQSSLSAHTQKPSARGESCMNVKVEMPPKSEPCPSTTPENPDLKYLLHEVVSNNNYVILEGINRLFRQQLRRLFTKVETLVRSTDGTQGREDQPSLLRAEDFALIDVAQLLGKSPPVTTVSRQETKVIKSTPTVAVKTEPEIVPKPPVAAGPARPSFRRTPVINPDSTDVQKDETPAEDAAEDTPVSPNKRQRFQQRRRLRIPFRGQRQQKNE